MMTDLWGRPDLRPMLEKHLDNYTQATFHPNDDPAVPGSAKAESAQEVHSSDPGTAGTVLNLDSAQHGSGAADQSAAPGNFHIGSPRDEALREELRQCKAKIAQLDQKVSSIENMQTKCRI